MRAAPPATAKGWACAGRTSSTASLSMRRERKARTISDAPDLASERDAKILSPHVTRCTPRATPPAAPHLPQALHDARLGTRVAIVGGGPGGYEAALVATQLGAQVTLIERQGIGGSAVLTDVVPSKSLIATAAQATEMENINELGLRSACGHSTALEVDLARVDDRVLSLAAAQSADIRARLERDRK